MAQSQDFFAALPGKKQFSELERSDHEVLVGGEIGTIVVGLAFCGVFNGPPIS